MTYHAVLRYLNSFTNYEKNTNYSYKKDLKLTRIRSLLALIGNPQDALAVIHIAGTKGKGSTCAFVAHILRESGFSVGLYTSPHLNDFRERIRILSTHSRNQKTRAADFEGLISKKELTSLVQELKPLIANYNHNPKSGQLTFFEVYTALAFWYFKRRQVDFVVLETGLGGRLDATNIVKSLVCGITPVSLEHVQTLGNSLSKIAAEKAGIIKQRGAIVVSARQPPEAKKIIHQRCKQFQAKLYEVTRKIKYFDSKKGIIIKGLNSSYKNLHLKLIGRHQIENAALAVGLVEGLSFHKIKIKPSAIRQGIKNTVWPGRCEVVGKSPLIILDGAQNLASVTVLKKAIRDNFKYRKLILILGISSDKDISGICKSLNSWADDIILTQASTKRAALPQSLAKYFQRKLYLTQSVKEARILAGRLAHKEDLILVTGSLFVVGEYRNV